MPMRQIEEVMAFVNRGFAYLRTNGSRLTTARAMQGVANRLSRPSTTGSSKRSPAKDSMTMLVRFDDAARVDWTSRPKWLTAPPAAKEGPLTTAWIISPPGESSGGHQNLFRFMSFLQKAGHRIIVYLYSSSNVPVDVGAVEAMVKRSPSYSDVNAQFAVYDPSVGIAPGVDAIFATGWETAYPAFSDKSQARRFYFVQDYEPLFYAVGSENALAENTYRFGFEAFTAGGWLASKLADDFGMVTHPFEFAADLSLYQRTNDSRRADVFFYARPVTMRRGFELGVMALAELKRQRPEVTIHMAGWDVSTWDIPFDYVNHGAMEVGDLSELYNKCAAALVMSLTNLSLLPLELLACGTIPVVNDAPNNRLVSDNPNIAYTSLSPRALAHRIIEVLDDEEQVEHSRRSATSVRSSSWERSGEVFVRSFEEAMNG